MKHHARVIKTVATARSTGPGRYMARYDTKIAFVLVKLLGGAELKSRGDPGLSSIIRTLETKYSWPIKRPQVLTVGENGDVVRTTAYSLSSVVAERALSDAFGFIAKVAIAQPVVLKGLDLAAKMKASAARKYC